MATDRPAEGICKRRVRFERAQRGVAAEGCQLIPDGDARRSANNGGYGNLNLRSSQGVDYRRRNLHFPAYNWRVHAPSAAADGACVTAGQAAEEQTSQYLCR